MSEIFLNDPGTLEAELPNVTLLPFPTDKQDANFELGVSMIIHDWYTLTTAVDNLWGGPQSAEKRDWLSGVIVDEFRNNKEIDIIYIHEILCGVMEDEFDTVIEDESTIPVATKIVGCYKECKEGNFENVKSKYAKWLAKQESKQKIVVNVMNDPLNPDISDDDNDDANDLNNNTNLGLQSGGHDLDGDVDMDVDLVEDPPRRQKQEPIVDDDGFTVVTSKRR